MKNLAKIKFFLDFASFLVRLFFSYRKFFEKIYIQPPIFFSSACSQEAKLQIHQVWHTYLDHTQNDKLSNARSLDSTPPPGLFRVKIDGFQGEPCNHNQWCQ